MLKVILVLLLSLLQYQYYTNRFLNTGTTLKRIRLLKVYTRGISSMEKDIIFNDETFWSAPFFIHNFGYVACLLVTPSGVDHCKGS